MGDYRCIPTSQKRILTLKKFTGLEKELPNDLFFRVHKSFNDSIEKINSIERNRIKIKDSLIPKSENYKERYYLKIGVRNG